MLPAESKQEIEGVTPEGVIVKKFELSSQLPFPQAVCVLWIQELFRSERKLIPTDEHFFEKRLPGIFMTRPEASVRALPKTKELESGREGVGQLMGSRFEIALERASEVVIGSEA